MRCINYATLQNELEERKNNMKMQDVHRYNSEQLNDLEEEERRKNEELRLRAFAQIQEQEDEIKRLNEVKCSVLLLLQQEI